MRAGVWEAGGTSPHRHLPRRPCGWEGKRRFQELMGLRPNLCRREGQPGSRGRAIIYWDQSTVEGVREAGVRWDSARGVRSQLQPSRPPAPHPRCKGSCVISRLCSPLNSMPREAERLARWMAGFESQL